MGTGLIQSLHRKEGNDEMDKEAFAISCLHSKRIGDDGAVIGSTVYSADIFCEKTHFLREWMRPEQIGRKAMLVNFSDAVAMNADPCYALVTLCIPRDMDESEISGLINSLEATAKEYGCEIIGGDTVGGELLSLSVTLISHTENPLTRRGIEPGDLLAYTGTLGESLRQLDALMRGEKIPDDGRFYRPVLRGEFIRRARPMLRAGMDISDGLFCDTGKLLDLNGLGMEPLLEIPPEKGMSGEEYEMLIAFSPLHRPALEELAESLEMPLNVFGRVCDNDFRYPCRSHHF